MKPTDFSVHVTSFLTHYLAAQRKVSPNTIKAYRDVFTLLLRFCRDVQGIAPERLRLEQMYVSLVEAFLDYLEREKKSSLRVGSGNSEPSFPDILTRSVLPGKGSSNFR